ncbi:MAG TPA: exodeoxyribonuclease III [Patescibacteria group bacterium]|nr:exodeoxyribonuclease III [Patescibacteria group bacterium]
MKIISFNINGINSAIKYGLRDFISLENADIYLFQEVKNSWDTIDDSLRKIPGYETYFYQAAKKGYSGLLAYVKTKNKPIGYKEGIGFRVIDEQARVQTLEFQDYYLVNTYLPHSGRELEKLPFKREVNEKFLEYCESLKKKKPLIIAGDLNVAHKDIDLANPRANMGNAGFTTDERDFFDKFLSHGYIDTFREFVKENGHYTWWSWRTGVRERNIGWRIDYFLVSENISKRVKKSWILKDILGSDHCPIGLEIL